MLVGGVENGDIMVIHDVERPSFCGDVSIPVIMEVLCVILSDVCGDEDMWSEVWAEGELEGARLDDEAVQVIGIADGGTEGDSDVSAHDIFDAAGIENVACEGSCSCFSVCTGDRDDGCARSEEGEIEFSQDWDTAIRGFFKDL